MGDLDTVFVAQVVTDNELDELTEADTDPKEAVITGLAEADTDPKEAVITGLDETDTDPKEAVITGLAETDTDPDEDTVIAGLAEVDTDPKEAVITGLDEADTDPDEEALGELEIDGLPVIDILARPDPVYVVVTVSVTPVGNVVILGVPESARDAVKEEDLVVVLHLDLTEVGLDDFDIVALLVADTDLVRAPLVVCFTEVEVVGVDEGHLLALAEAE